MNISEICQLLKTANETGVSFLEVDGMKIMFHVKHSSNHQVQPSIQEIIKKEVLRGEDFTKKNSQDFAAKEIRIEDILKPPSIFDPANMTEEEIKFAATPHFGQLMAEKEERLRKLREANLGGI